MGSGSAVEHSTARTPPYSAETRLVRVQLIHRRLMIARNPARMLMPVPRASALSRLRRSRLRRVGRSASAGRDLVTHSGWSRRRGLPGSAARVDVVCSAIEDLRGVARLMASGRILRFMGVGVASTLAYALLFVALRGALGAGGANAVALALAAVANTAANRRLTFGMRGREGLLRQHLLGAGVYVITLGLTSGALEVLHGLSATPSRALELAVLVAASAGATITRYVALRSWVFARKRHRTPASAPTTLSAGRRPVVNSPPLGVARSTNSPGS
jgi:putative flippase GtrA